MTASPAIPSPDSDAPRRIIPMPILPTQEVSSYLGATGSARYRPGMADARELIRARLNELGLSMSAVSRDRLGKNHAYLQQFIERGIPQRLPEDVRAALAATLGLEERDLRDSPTAPPRKPIGPSPTPPRPTITEQNDVVPILGMAEGGPEGWNLWNGEPIAFVRRPPNLIGVRGAYGVYITGTSMDPRYMPGEIAFINPAKPVQPGCFVLVQRNPMQAGEPPLAIVKRLVRRTADKVTLEQLNPHKQFNIPASSVHSMHRVVASGEG